MLSILASNCVKNLIFALNWIQIILLKRRNSLAKLEQFSGFTSAMHKPALVSFEYHTEHRSAINIRHSASLNDDRMCFPVATKMVI